MRTGLHRLLKPRRPDDCPACRLASPASSVVGPVPVPVRPWSEVKSRRGAPKRVNTEGFACPHHLCPYFGITDTRVHASSGRWQAWPYGANRLNTWGTYVCTDPLRKKRGNYSCASGSSEGRETRRRGGSERSATLVLSAPTAFGSAGRSKSGNCTSIPVWGRLRWAGAYDGARQ